MSRIVLSVLVVAALGATLVGCAPPAPGGSPTALPPAPTETAAPTPTAEADPDLLFTITANVTASNGATAFMIQKVWKPTDATDARVAPLVTKKAVCKDTWAAYLLEDDEWMPTEITSELTSGTEWPGPDNATIGVSANGYPEFAGDFITFQAYCATVIAKVPGTITGTTPVGIDLVDGEPAWTTFQWGFGDTGSDSTFTSCTIELSDEAAASSAAAEWPALAASGRPDRCDFGFPTVTAG